MTETTIEPRRPLSRTARIEARMERETRELRQARQDKNKAKAERYKHRLARSREALEDAEERGDDEREPTVEEILEMVASAEAPALEEVDELLSVMGRSTKLRPGRKEVLAAIEARRAELAAKAEAAEEPSEEDLVAAAASMGEEALAVLERDEQEREAPREGVLAAIASSRAQLAPAPTAPSAAVAAVQLIASEAIPLIAEMTAEQLDEAEPAEQAGKKRKTVLDAINERRASLAATPA